MRYPCRVQNTEGSAGGAGKDTERPDIHISFACRHRLAQLRARILLSVDTAGERWTATSSVRAVARAPGHSCVCVRDRERERVCVCARQSVCGGGGARERVCMREIARDSERE